MHLREYGLQISTESLKTTATFQKTDEKDRKHNISSQHNISEGNQQNRKHKNIS